MLCVIEDIGLRNYQEDRHSICFNFFKDFHYFSVFDGHGDEKVAVFLKLYFLKIITNELIKSYPQISIEKCLYNAMKTANKIIPYNISVNAGSTAIIIIKQNTNIYVANIGDSRVVINNFDKAVQVTEDHKPDVPAEYNRIINLGGKVTKDIYGIARINNILSLSRSIGDFNLLPYISWVPDIYRMQITDANKYLIAATDGLWDVFENQELVNYINNNLSEFNNDLQHIDNRMSVLCKNLLKIARLKGSKDNITILLLTLCNY